MIHQSQNSRIQDPRSLTHRGYRIKTILDETTAQNLIDALIDKTYPIEKILKNGRSTYAAHLKIEGEDLVYKIPKARLKRLGEKLATLIRKGESIRTFHNLQLMLQLGFKAPIPLLSGEKRKRGCVVDSFCCYRFVDGDEAGPNDAQKVVTELGRLHEMGYLRTDAKASNFLINKEGVTFIDFRLKKPVLFTGLKKNMELARLARVYPESSEHIPMAIRDSTSFRLAAWLEQKLLEIRKVRRRIKPKKV